MPNLSRLEWVRGEIYANVWHTDRIARIDPNTGRVTGWIDLAGLWEGSDHEVKTLNGITYDADHDRLFVTGKLCSLSLLLLLAPALRDPPGPASR